MRALVSALSFAAAVSGARNSQLQKVIELLENMAAEGTKVMNAEQVLWSEAKVKCESETTRLQRAIEDDKREISKQEGAISDAQADQADLTERVEGHTADIATHNARNNKLKKERDAEHAKFLTEEMDLNESVSALVRASSIIERQHSKNQAIAQTSFLQLQKMKLPAKALELLSLKTGSDPNAYESKSKGVLELLDGLEEDFKKQLHQCKMDELNRKQNWELETQRLVDLIETAQNAVADRSVTLSERKADEGEAAKELAAASDELKADTDTHRETSVVCSQKQKSFADKQDLRQEELEAQNQAITALKAVPGASSAGSSFLQIKDPNQLENAQVGMWIRNQGAKLNSQILVQLADKIAEDPFAKVKVMIKDMVSKIQKEMQDAQETKNFCELGFSKNKKKQEKLDAAVAKYSSLIEKNADKSASLKQDVKELNEKIQASNDAMTQVTQERIEEKSLNQKKIKDAQDGQAGLGNAIQVLTDFYAKAKSVTAFIQTSTTDITIGSPEWDALNGQEAAASFDPRKYHQAGEETFGATYKGQQDKSQVVIGILEVILSDFAREQSEVEASETQAQAAHEKFIQQEKVSVKKMSTTSTLKEADAQEAEAALATAKTDLKETNKSVQAVQEERAALVPMCPAEHGGTLGVVTFEERTAQRKSEIDSLKQALELLKPKEV